MPSPFPGMDPYLESPYLWPDVHHELISEMRNSLNGSIRPNYVARVELRVYVSDENDPGRRVIIPDTRIEQRGDGHEAETQSYGASALAIVEPMIVPILMDEEIKEARIEIRDVKDKSLVTVIEVMSPTNKIRGSEGRKSFLKKRHEILASDANWVEIDLLRAGAPSQPTRAQSDYRIMISKGPNHFNGRLWPVSVRQPFPVVGIPLRAPDADVPFDLGAVLRTAYDRAAYDLTVDYSAPPDPPLGLADAKWAEDLLREKAVGR